MIAIIPTRDLQQSPDVIVRALKGWTCAAPGCGTELKPHESIYLVADEEGQIMLVHGFLSCLNAAESIGLAQVTDSSGAMLAKILHLSYGPEAHRREELQERRKNRRSKRSKKVSRKMRYGRRMVRCRVQR